MEKSVGRSMVRQHVMEARAWGSKNWQFEETARHNPGPKLTALMQGSEMIERRM